MAICSDNSNKRNENIKSLKTFHTKMKATMNAEDDYNKWHKRIGMMYDYFFLSLLVVDHNEGFR